MTEEPSAVASRSQGPAREPLLELRDINVRFGAVQALTDVNLKVYSGEVLALVGDNGAGKSTLIKCIAGINIPDHGQILFEGKEVRFTGPRDPTALGISTVYQDLALSDNLDVVANLYLGREETDRPIPSISEEQMEKRAREVLADLNVTTLQSPRLVVASLSGGQRQSVAVARSVMWSAKVVILDEPTAALGVAQTKQVLDLILRLKQQGHAVIVISHNLGDVFEVADRIVVLRLGRNAGDFEAKDVDRDDVVAAITGANIAAASAATPGTATPTA
ncbi:MAG TPA: ATP-binding cassette domain-containing protein [Candidatus Solibacter sp.]|nr:ATP-binding cassette domain-containing protein [Candidatus Solibacter sp.]